jgi:hypothetical protein
LLLGLLCSAGVSWVEVLAGVIISAEISADSRNKDAGIQYFTRMSLNQWVCVATSALLIVPDFDHRASRAGTHQVRSKCLCQGQ